MYSTNSEGGGNLALTAQEVKDLTDGKPVVKRSGDSHGMFTITVKITRPRAKKDRFPEQVYGDLPCRPGKGRTC